MPSTNQITTRRNLFRIGAAAAVTATAPYAMAAVGRGDDAELLAMIARADALWARQCEVNARHIGLVRSLLSPEREFHPDEEYIEAMKDPRAAALGREIKALEDAASALDEPIRSFRPNTLEGAVAQAAFLRHNDDFQENLLANLRRIVEGLA